MTRDKRMAKIYEEYLSTAKSMDELKARMEALRKIIDAETDKSTDRDATHYGKWFAHYGEAKTAETYDMAKLFAEHPELDKARYIKKPAGVTVKFYGVKEW